MEGIHTRVPWVRATIAVAGLLATLIVSGCLGPPRATPGSASSPAGFHPSAESSQQDPGITISEPPDTPQTTSALALDRPRRGSNAPVGAVVFGSDFNVGSKSVAVVGEKTTFPEGQQIAWRVTLPQAVGGESVRVTLTTEDETETLIDQFVAQTGWNVYYGKQLLTVAPGTYVLHYLVNGHEVGSGTFKIELEVSPTTTEQPITTQDNVASEEPTTSMQPSSSLEPAATN